MHEQNIKNSARNQKFTILGTITYTTANGFVWFNLFKYVRTLLLDILCNLNSIYF